MMIEVLDMPDVTDLPELPEACCAFAAKEPLAELGLLPALDSSPAPSRAEGQGD